jgi:hypothetical protein
MHLSLGKLMGKYAEIQTPTQEEAETMLSEMGEFYRSSEKIVDSTKHGFSLFQTENEKVLTGLDKDAEVSLGIVNRILAYQEACVFYTKAINALSAVEETIFKAKIAYFIAYHATGVHDFFAQETDQSSDTLLENSKRAIVIRYSEAAVIARELVTSLERVDKISTIFAKTVE